MKCFRVASAYFLSGREFGLSEAARSLDVSSCPQCEPVKTNGSCASKPGQIKCARCFHSLTQPNATFLRDLPNHHAHSVTHLEEFLGQENVTILEFVNPSNFHFLAIQLDQLNVVGVGDWVGGDSWFEGDFFSLP